jgi:RNase P protein component
VDLLASDQRFKAVFCHQNRWLKARAVPASPRRGGCPAIGVIVANAALATAVKIEPLQENPSRGRSPQPGRNPRQGHSPGGRRRLNFGAKKRVDLLASDQRFKAVFSHQNRWLKARAVPASPRRGGCPAIGVIVANTAVATAVKIEPLQENPSRGPSPKPGRNPRQGHSPGGRRRLNFGPKKRVDLLASDQRFQAVFCHPNRWLAVRAVLDSPRRGKCPAIGMTVASAAVAAAVRVEPRQENAARGLSPKPGRNQRRGHSPWRPRSSLPRALKWLVSLAFHSGLVRTFGVARCRRMAITVSGGRDASNFRIPMLG